MTKLELWIRFRDHPDSVRVMVVSRVGVADDIESIVLEPLMEGQEPVLQLRAFVAKEQDGKGVKSEVV